MRRIYIMERNLLIRRIQMEAGEERRWNCGFEVHTGVVATQRCHERNLDCLSSDGGEKARLRYPTGIN